MAMNILIVDDSAVMRAVIKRTIGMADIQYDKLYEAGSGKEALKTMRDEEINLVLADINMPEMTGLEMTERMFACPSVKDIPVIIVSTEASTARIQDLKSKGVKGYVHKPFTPEQIRDEVLKVIGACNA
ncbi:MAG: response regulator [Phycisphaerae bacterium]|nr:response regulator [Phycisphaerae bacterium]